MDDSLHVFLPLALLSRTTRWPQPNAKKIRKAAFDLHNKVAALAVDAYENGHIRSLEKRLALNVDLNLLINLLWAYKSGERDVFLAVISSHRETPPNEGIPTVWARKTST